MACEMERQAWRLKVRSEATADGQLGSEPCVRSKTCACISRICCSANCTSTPSTYQNLGPYALTQPRAHLQQV